MTWAHSIDLYPSAKNNFVQNKKENWIEIYGFTTNFIEKMILLQSNCQNQMYQQFSLNFWIEAVLESPLPTVKNPIQTSIVVSVVFWLFMKRQVIVIPVKNE